MMDMPAILPMTKSGGGTLALVAPGVARSERIVWLARPHPWNDLVTGTVEDITDRSHLEITFITIYLLGPAYR